MFDDLAFAAVKLATRAPRGGFFVARTLAAVVPGLKLYPVPTRYGRVLCDLSESVCYPLVKYGEYPHWRPDEEAMARMSAGCVVLDIGANIGVTARIFAQRAAHVHAFEPSPRALRLLRANTRDLPNVTVHATAVSSEPGTVFFEERVALDISGIGTGAGAVEVPVTTVDALGLDPGFIKIDVEGFEPAVLRGATQTLRRGPAVMFEALSPAAREECEAIIRAANPAYRFEALGSGYNHLALAS